MPVSSTQPLDKPRFDWCCCSPASCFVETLKWIIGKVIDVAGAIFNWLTEDPSKELSQEYIWSLVSRPSSGRRRVRHVRPGVLERNISVSEVGDSPTGGRATSARRPSLFEDVAALSIDELARRPHISKPHLAYLYKFCMQTASNLSTIIYEETVRPSERSIQRFFLACGRWLEKGMNLFNSNFSPVNALFADLLELKSLNTEEDLSKRQRELIERIRRDGSSEELTSLFSQQYPHPSEDQINEYREVVTLFFQMIEAPEDPTKQEFWNEENVPEVLRKRVLYDVLMLFVATPVATFLEEMNTNFTDNRSLSDILFRCFQDNGVLIARILFKRLKYLFDHKKFEYTELFDDVITLLNDQAYTLDFVEKENALLFEEAESWENENLSKHEGENLVVKWQSALSEKIVSGISQLSLRWKTKETLFLFERGIVDFNASPLRGILDDEQRKNIDAKLKDIRERLPDDSEEKEKLAESAKFNKFPRFLMQLQLQQALVEERIAELPEAEGESIKPLIKAFKAHVTSQRQMQYCVGPEEKRDYGVLAERILTLLLPSHSEKVDEHFKSRDGLTAVIDQMVFPEELQDLFRFALEKLPAQIFGEFWDDGKQEMFMASMHSPGAKLVKDGLRSLLIKEMVRPFIKNLLEEGLKALFAQLSGRNSLDDMMALNVFPLLNDLLLTQLALLTLTSNLKEVGTYFEAKRSPEELTQALEIWTIEHIKGVYQETKEGRLTWEKDVDKARLQPLLSRELETFQKRLKKEVERLKKEGKELTEVRFQELLTLHFKPPPEEDVMAPQVYGDLVENLLSLGRLGNVAEKIVSSYIRETIQTGLVVGLQEYRSGPQTLLSEGMRSLGEILTREELELLFQGSQENVEAEQEVLKIEQERLEDGQPRFEEIQQRLAKLEVYQRQFAKQDEIHAPERIKDIFDQQVGLIAKLSFELIDGLAGAYTPSYLGGGFVGRIASSRLLSGNSSHLDQVIHACYESLVGHQSVNEDLMFRVFHATVDTLSAVDVPQKNSASA